MSGRHKLYRQYELMEEIRKDPRASIQELCKRMNIKSKSQVHDLLRRLEDEGLITREPRLARSISLGGSPRRAKSEMKARHSLRTASASVTTKATRSKSSRHPVTHRKCDDGWQNHRQTKAQLQARIEEIVRRANQQSAGVDVMNDFRRPFGRRIVHAVKVS